MVHSLLKYRAKNRPMDLLTSYRSLGKRYLAVDPLLHHYEVHRRKELKRTCDSELGTCDSELGTIPKIPSSRSSTTSLWSTQAQRIEKDLWFWTWDYS